MIAVQQALSRPDLERVCLAYLRMLLRSPHVTKVTVAPRLDPHRNWAVIAIEPPLPASEEDDARRALLELQMQFRLEEQ